MKLALAKIALLLLLLTTPFPARAALQQQPVPQQQQPAQNERPSLAAQVPGIPVIHVESRLVSVALNVSDAHGTSAPGLTAADFDLTEDSLPQRIAVFDAESATPLDIVLAIDASGSVFTDDRLEHDAAKEFVHSLLRPRDQIDLMAFSDRVDNMVAFTNNPRQIDSGLARIRKGDATALYDAISVASQKLAQMPSTLTARRVIVLITDGGNTTSHASYSAAVERAERAGAMIYPLILVPITADAGRNIGGEHALIQMARDTGGAYVYVGGKTGLVSAFAHVSADLRTQYTVGYYAPQRGADSSGLRHIHLQLKDPALRTRYSLRYRTAYYANP